MLERIEEGGEERSDEKSELEDENPREFHLKEGKLTTVFNSQMEKEEEKRERERERTRSGGEKRRHESGRVESRKGFSTFTDSGGLQAWWATQIY